MNRDIISPKPPPERNCFLSIPAPFVYRRAVFFFALSFSILSFGCCHKADKTEQKASEETIQAEKTQKDLIKEQILLEGGPSRFMFIKPSPSLDSGFGGMGGINIPIERGAPPNISSPDPIFKAKPEGDPDTLKK